MRIFKSLGVVLASCVWLFGAVCAAQTAALEKVRMASWGKPISEVINLLVEEEKGFFRAQGIDLIFISGSGGGDAIRNLLSKQADIAFTDPGSFFLALAKGEKLRAIYDIYPQNIFNVVSLKSRGLTKPEDLKGKKIGVYSLNSGTRTNLQLLLNQAGLSESDVTIVVTGLLNFAPLIQGQVDATAATDTGLMVGLQKGLGEVHVMEVKQYLNYSSDIFVVREDTYRDQKDLLKRFLAAYKASALWMQSQPQEAAKLAIRRALDGQNEAINLEVIKLRNQTSVSTLTERRGLGALDLETLQKAADAYFKTGLLEKPLIIRHFVNQDLVPSK
jgi:NitT/TauT family transport system substrate-binding protein